MGKHTKGDWVSLGYRVDVDVADGLSGICEMSDWMGEDEMKANAALISAAPDLLEALKICYASLCTYGKHPIISMQVENAIAKAEGR